MTNKKKLTERKQALLHYQKGQLYCPNVYTWVHFYYEDFSGQGRSNHMNEYLKDSRLCTSLRNTQTWASRARGGEVKAKVIEPFCPFLIIDVSIMPIAKISFNMLPTVEQMGKVVLQAVYKDKLGYLASEVISYPNEDDPGSGFRTFDPYMEKWLGADHEKLTSHL